MTLSRKSTPHSNRTHDSGLLPGRSERRVMIGTPAGCICSPFSILDRAPFRTLPIRRRRWDRSLRGRIGYYRSSRNRVAWDGYSSLVSRAVRRSSELPRVRRPANGAGVAASASRLDADTIRTSSGTIPAPRYRDSPAGGRARRAIPDRRDQAVSFVLRDQFCGAFPSTSFLVCPRPFVRSASGRLVRAC